MFHQICVKYYHQNALFCLSEPSKRYLVHIAQATVFVDNKQKQIGFDNQKICNKHPASV